jgi:hypothetical protein
MMGKTISRGGENGLYDPGTRDWSSEIAHWKEYQPNKVMCWTGTRFTGPPTLLASEYKKCSDIEIDFSIIEEKY